MSETGNPVEFGESLPVGRAFSEIFAAEFGGGIYQLPSRYSQILETLQNEQAELYQPILIDRTGEIKPGESREKVVGIIHVNKPGVISIENMYRYHVAVVQIAAAEFSPCESDNKLPVATTILMESNVKIGEISDIILRSESFDAKYHPLCESENILPAGELIVYSESIKPILDRAFKATSRIIPWLKTGTTANLPSLINWLGR